MKRSDGCPNTMTKEGLPKATSSPRYFGFVSRQFKCGKSGISLFSPVSMVGQRTRLSFRDKKPHIECRLLGRGFYYMGRDGHLRDGSVCLCLTSSAQVGCWLNLVDQTDTQSFPFQCYEVWLLQRKTFSAALFTCFSLGLMLLLGNSGEVCQLFVH